MGTQGEAKKEKQTNTKFPLLIPFLACTANKKNDNGHTNNKKGMTGRRRVYPRNKTTTEMSSGEEEEEKPHLPIFDGCPTHPFATGKWRWPKQQRNRLRTKWRVLETWWPCSTTLALPRSCKFLLPPVPCLSLSVGRSLANSRDTAHTACNNPEDCCGRGDDLAHRPCERKPISSVFFFKEFL